jgi:hypothetical protein
MPCSWSFTFAIFLLWLKITKNNKYLLCTQYVIKKLLMISRTKMMLVQCLRIYTHNLHNASCFTPRFLGSNLEHPYKCWNLWNIHQEIIKSFKLPTKHSNPLRDFETNFFILALNCFATIGHNQVFIVVFDMYTQLRYVRNARDFCCKVLMHLVIYAHSHIVKDFAQTKSHNQTLPLFMLL